MPEDGSKLCNVAVLADDQRQVELAMPLASFARLAPLLASPDGMATGRIAFARAQGRIVADVTAAARPQVRCQRCLGTMSLPISSQSRVALVASEGEVDAVPQDLEVALAPEGRMRLADLVEEELLLALPGAPRHAEGQCPDESGRGARDGTDEPARRPFADLRRMMKPD